MSCILCFGSTNCVTHYKIDENSVMELIYKYFDFAQMILTEETIENPDSCVCQNCWVNLENFNDFHTLVTDNYNNQTEIQDEPTEAKEFFPESFIVYEEEDDKGIINQMVEEDCLNETEYIETEWIEDEDSEEVTRKSPLKSEKTLLVGFPKKEKISTVPGLDSADDQRVRETANMFCELCHVQLDSLREAKSHYKITHETEGYIMCCERKFRQRCRLVEHVNTHYNYSHSCPFCGKTFDSKSYLVKHLACHDRFKQYKCDHCPKAFSKKFQVRNHLLNVHIFDNVEPTFECQVEGCSKKFVSQGRLKHHVDYTHSLKHTEICEICSKQFRTKPAIDEHMKTHVRKPEDRKQCPICGNYLADLKSYKRHVKNHETEKLDNTCSFCGKKSPNQNALKKHIKFVHEMSRSFQCRFCEKSFKRPRNLTDHEAAMHTLQDLYACTFCTKTFRNQSNMLAHRKKMHPDQYQKPKYKRDSL